MTGTRRRGLAALAACLLAVGLIRAAIPAYLPDEYTVPARADGVAHGREATVELLDLSTASAIRTADEWSEEEFRATDGAILLLARVRITAHQGPFLVRAQLRTEDGYSYDALLLSGFPQPGVVHVGMTLTNTLIFEVPEDRLTGRLAVHGSRSDGLQPVAAVLTFPLSGDLDPNPGEVVVAADVMEPVR